MQWVKPDRETKEGERVYVQGEGRDQFQLKDEGGGAWVIGCWNNAVNITSNLRDRLVCYIPGPPAEGEGSQLPEVVTATLKRTGEPNLFLATDSWVTVLTANGFVKGRCNTLQDMAWVKEFEFLPADLARLPRWISQATGGGTT